MLATRDRPASRLVCAGCGARAARPRPVPVPLPERRPRRRRRPRPAPRARPRAAVVPAGDDEPNPFVRYRTLLHAYHVAVSHGFADAEFCALVRDLDERVAAVDGHGFAARRSRAATSSAPARLLGRGGVWVKDETGNVSGSHKARHLFGVLL